jgi:transcription elongation GreA/GreB family factor
MALVGRDTIGCEEAAMITLEQKRAILEELNRTLAEMIETSVRSAAAAQEGMMVGSERTRTRGERGQFNEQAYLIGAQMKQVEEYRSLQHSLAELDLAPARKVRAGSLVTVRTDGGEEIHYFMVPGGMGLTMIAGGGSVHLLSPDSPLGQALLGRRPGVRVQATLPAGAVELHIYEVG